MSFILSLYDHRIHSGQVKFTYGQPFSYFTEQPKRQMQSPPGFQARYTSDLNTNAPAYYSPVNSPPNSPVNSPPNTPRYIVYRASYLN